MFDFRGAPVFSLGHRFSKQKMTGYAKKLRGEGPLATPMRQHGHLAKQERPTQRDKRMDPSGRRMQNVLKHNKSWRESEK